MYKEVACKKLKEITPLLIPNNRTGNQACCLETKKHYTVATSKTSLTLTQSLWYNNKLKKYVRVAISINLSKVP